MEEAVQRRDLVEAEARGARRALDGQLGAGHQRQPVLRHLQVGAAPRWEAHRVWARRRRPRRARPDRADGDGQGGPASRRPAGRRARRGGPVGSGEGWRARRAGAQRG
eukprot:1297547-Prymnesium_polylepis.1